MSSEDWSVTNIGGLVNDLTSVLDRLHKAESRVRFLERVLKQAVITHGGKLRISHAAIVEIKDHEVLEFGSDSSDPGFGWVTLGEEDV